MGKEKESGSALAKQLPALTTSFLSKIGGRILVFDLFVFNSDIFEKTLVNEALQKSPGFVILHR